MLTNVPEKHTRYLRILWAIFGFVILLIMLIFFLIIRGKLGFMPSFQDLENPRNNLASEVITEDGKILGNFYVENRSYVGFNELSPHLVNALIAREDHRFRRHAGIDALGLVRVAVRTILMGQSGAGGGSTITQQLAKNLFPRDTASNQWGVVRKVKLVGAKFKEWVTAVRLERNYTKDEIIVMYFNTVFFGHDAYGIKSAALTFFDKSPDSLNIEEAALLVGVLKGQTKYSPITNPERSKLRRDGVLDKMREHGFITEAQFDSLIKIPIQLKFSLQSHNQGYGTYFRAYISTLMNRKEPLRKNFQNYATYLEDSARWMDEPLFGWCNKNLKPDGTPYDLYRDGLKIYTTINYTMQVYAEQAMQEHLGGTLQDEFFLEKKAQKRGPFSKDLTNQEIDGIMNTSMKRSDRYRMMQSSGISNDSIYKAFHTRVQMTVFTWKGEVDTMLTPWDSIKYYKNYLQAGFVAMNPHTGHVMAYVGGPNFRHFKYDHVIVGKRQVGSTIKPFLYTLAMQEGLSPCDKVPNMPSTFIVNDTVWTPKNSGRTRFEGKKVTLKWGLANSVNYISAWVIKQFNPESVIEIMKKMGVKSFIDPVPSIFLGTSDISLYEMVSAYGTFANKGVHVSPVLITRIEDKNGNLLGDFHGQTEESISEETAYLMIDMLKAVVLRGTANRLRYSYQLMNEIAGKTGTTQNHSDGWFVGITPDLVGGAWVGAEDRGVHFDELNLGQGAHMALPIWALFMQKVYADTSLHVNIGPFERPLNFNINTNCDESELNDIVTNPEEYEME